MKPFLNWAELGPGQARYVYVYGVALHSAGRREEALKILERGLASHPADRDILFALAAFTRDRGDLASALDYAQRLARLAPDDRKIASFVEELQRQTRSQGAK